MKKAKDIFNPYPGLRPFDSTEENLFFGRQSQTGVIVEKILRKKFIAIIGSSGSGKTSMVNAGIIPDILKSGKNGAGSSWKIIKTKPGKAPIDNLAISLADTDNTSHEDYAKLLKNNSQGLAEALTQINKTTRKKIILVIDGFEDLFRFQRSLNNRTVIHEHERYIRFLLETRKQESLPVYILLSIRSDFLEECQQFQELNFLINESNYILPQIKRDELKEIINKPAAIAGTKIDPKLELQLLNDIKDKPDYLPLLQHILYRMFENWAKENNQDRPITCEDYADVGTIENAISRHADEAYLELPDSGKLMCERIFKTITEKGTDNHDFTTPERIADIAFITRVGVKDLIGIVSRFTQPGRSFLTTDHNDELNSDTIIDLSHESLIRLWARLRIWVDEESRSVQMYKRLAEASRLYQMGKAELWTSPDIQQAIQWRDKFEPSFEWAQRFNTAFERTMQFLNLSQEAYYLEEEERREEPQKKLRKARILTIFAILLVLAAAGFTYHIFSELSETRARLETALHDERPSPDDAVVSSIVPAESSNAGSTVPDTGEQQARQAPPASRPAASAEPAATAQQQPVRQTEPVPQARTEQQPRVTEQQPRVTEPTPGVTEQPTRVTEQAARVAEQVSIESAVSSREVTMTEEELKRRMVEISQSLAKTSLEVENDPDLKALLAFQSHIFNDNYNGASYNANIYTSLIASIQRLYGSGHNVYKGHSESVNSLVFRPNSTIFYSASSDGQVLQWDMDDETRTPRVLARNSVVNNKLAISPNGQWLAIGTDGIGLQILSPARNLPNPYQITYGNNRVIDLDFYPDSEDILFAGSDRALVKHNIRSGTNTVISKLDSDILSVAVSPDGNMIAAGTRDGKVLILRGDVSPVPQMIHNEEGNDILTLSFNRNGTRLAAGSISGEIRILDVASGNLLATLRGHSARVVDIDFSPDNRLIASSSFDGSIHLWNAQNLNARPVVIREHGSWVRSVAFNSRGNKLVSGSRQEARLRAWTTSPAEMATMICEGLSRNMTLSEWNKHIGEGIPYRESCSQLSER